MDVAGRGFLLWVLAGVGICIFVVLWVSSSSSVVLSVWVFDGHDNDDVGDDFIITLSFDVHGLIVIFYLIYHRGSDFLILELYGKVFSVFF